MTRTSPCTVSAQPRNWLSRFASRCTPSRLFVTTLAGVGLFAAMPAAADELSGANTAWVLTSTALVLFMTIPGLSLFYGGLVRTKNSLSILMQCFTITCLVSVLWLLLGYSLAFDDGNSFIGGLNHMLFAGIIEGTLSGDIPESSFALFQMTFAIITPALVVGGFAERMRFSAVVLFSALWLLGVYVPVCHWVWGGGWLGDLGFMDFCLLYTSPSPRDQRGSRMPSSA